MISLKKLIKKKEVSNVIMSLINVIEASVIIEDADGGVLLRGSDSPSHSEKYPVKVSEDIIGWVRGGGNALPIASFLSLLADKEDEINSLAIETLDKYKEINIFYNTIEGITASLELKEVARMVIDEAGKFIKLTSASVMLLNENTKVLEILSAFGKEYNPKINLTPGKGIAGAVFLTGKGEIVNDVRSDSRYIEGANRLNSLICAPLKVKEKVIGVFNIGSDEPVQYTAEHLKFSTVLALHLAITIENARLYERLSETFISLVQTLAETIEKRDPYTAGHTKRVMDFSLAIGRGMNLSKGELFKLKLAAILHDIGKIGVRDNILLKIGNLSDAEFEIMKKHPVYGEEILKHIKELNNIIPGVRYHHERCDGLGYPDGLTGDEIHIMGKIIAVADAFDAMRTDRPYRKGLSLKMAFEELKTHSGTQFDPDVVNAFFTAYEDAGIFEKEVQGGL